MKDLLGHLGSWMAGASHQLVQMRVGTWVSQPIDVDAMNEVFFEANRDLPLSVVKAECWSARNIMLLEWNALPVITDDAEEWFVESGPQHYREHEERLREWAVELRARA